jgi:hypothetical protein
LANNSSPLFSANLKPALRAGSGTEGPLPCAYAGNDSSKDAADIATAKPARKLVFSRVI